MPNSIPYLILTAFSVIAISVLMLHKRAAWPLILLLSFSGMIYVFEFFIYLWFDSYRYFPRLVGIPFYDSTLGAVVSNLLAVPVAAAYVAVYRLSWRWIVCLALIFAGIEWLFLELGIYEQYWWKTAYTLIAQLFFFRLARQWPIWLAGRGRVIRFVTLLMISWSVAATLVFVLALTGIRIFHIGYFADPYHDDLFISAIYSFLKAVVLASFVTAGRRPLTKAISLLVIFAAHIVLMRLGIIKIMIPLWQFWLIYAPCCTAVLCLIAVIRHKLERFGTKSYTNNRSF
ncbi:hypothetical protein KP806_00650 [Paenibacillus sp. N4]|uniref:hypothetical protein n=1 Tax=Paenibacillus vietnamensis TaxID=2590547 RepID=UPI001CD09740|nr:hypothetical protein [Paenibacillus vietnamensis]MCA0753543.1 hypothetical protein [Paenibacillus vietnamensis]